MTMMANKYSFQVFWSAGDEGYIGTCAEFPRISGFGDTPEEALTEVQVALELAVDAYQAQGRPLPEPKGLPAYSGQFRVRLPRQLHAQLATQAAEDGVSLNTLVATYLAAALGSATTLLALQDAFANKVLAELEQPLARITTAAVGLHVTNQRLQRLHNQTEQQLDAKLRMVEQYAHHREVALGQPTGAEYYLPKESLVSTAATAGSPELMDTLFAVLRSSGSLAIDSLPGEQEPQQATRGKR